jgi:uncharacterized RDD family membrane protein YckC
MTNYAGFWRRVAATLIDSLIIGAVMGVVGLGSIMEAPPYMMMYHHYGADYMGGYSYSFILSPRFFVGLAVVAAGFAMLKIIISWLYYAILESSKYQATVGKIALGIKVTDLNGARVSFPRATGRYFGKIVSAAIFMIGFLMVAFTEKKQGLHDILAKTLVVNK